MKRQARTLLTTAIILGLLLGFCSLAPAGPPPGGGGVVIQQGGVKVGGAGTLNFGAVTVANGVATVTGALAGEESDPILRAIVGVPLCNGTTCSALSDVFGTVLIGTGSGIAFSANPAVSTINVFGTNSLNLGTTGSLVGQLTFKNGTSGSITLQPITGALGTRTLVLGTTYTDGKWCSYATATGFTCTQDAPGTGGYTNLTSFVDQTAWRLFYSDGSGDVKELALGANGTYLKSQGASSVPTFDTPSGTGGADNSTIDSRINQALADDKTFVGASFSANRGQFPEYYLLYEDTRDGNNYWKEREPDHGAGGRTADVILIHPPCCRFRARRRSSCPMRSTNGRTAARISRCVSPNRSPRTCRSTSTSGRT